MKVSSQLKGGLFVSQQEASGVFNRERLVTGL